MSTVVGTLIMWTRETCVPGIKIFDLSVQGRINIHHFVISELNFKSDPKSLTFFATVQSVCFQLLISWCLISLYSL